MLTKFKLRLYNFIKQQLVSDETFVRELYSKLEDEKRFRAALARDIQQRKDIAAKLAAKKKLQDACSHLKGGTYSSAKLGSDHFDFCISDHHFPDGIRKVKCLLCSKEFDPESSEAIYMLENTTNTKTASEFHPDSYDRSEPVAVFQETIDVNDGMSTQVGRNMSVEEPFAPWMSLKRWAKLDAIYKKLCADKKKPGEIRISKKKVPV